MDKERETTNIQSEKYIENVTKKRQKDKQAERLKESPEYNTTTIN